MPTKVSQPKFEFHQAQIEIVEDSHRFRVVNCGRRFGKTVLSIYEMVQVASEYPNSRTAYIAPTYQQARDISWNQLKDIVAPVALKINESRLEITLKNKSQIILRGWEAVETLRGQYFHFLVIDEIASMKHFFLNWQEVLLPTLTDKRGEVLFLSTPKGFNHFYDLFNMEAKDPDFKSFHFTSFDNPHLPKADLKKYRNQMTEDRFAQEYMADFRKAEGLVYKEFSRETHVLPAHNTPTPPLSSTSIIGADFGWNHPAVLLHILVDHDGRFWVMDEWYKQHKTIEQMIEVAQKFTPQVTMTYPDQAEPANIEQMKKAGLNPREVSKRVIPGIDKVREMLLQKRIIIHPRCQNLILEFETYSYPDDSRARSSRTMEHPLKENDDAMDALRYAIFNHRQTHRAFENRVQYINQVRTNKAKAYD